MKPCLLLSGSRGASIDLDLPCGTRSVRVNHRALPLSLVHEIGASYAPLHYVIAIGGGTVMDAAKALLSLQAAPWETHLDLIPTTFGTGAEVTRFATVYDDGGRKKSVLLPESTQVRVQYHSELLHSLPEIELCAGFCDAFTHCFESLWALKANAESVALATEGIRIGLKILSHWGRRTKEDFRALQSMGRLAGQAISLSQTAAAHALSYEWTQKWRIPHGFAVAASLPALHSLYREGASDQGSLWMQARAMEARDLSAVHDQLLRMIHFLIPADVRACLSQALQSGRVQAPCPVRLANFPLVLDPSLIINVDRQTAKDLNANPSSTFVIEQKGCARDSMGVTPPAEPWNSPGP
jgi:hypothetical protein